MRKEERRAAPRLEAGATRVGGPGGPAPRKPEPKQPQTGSFGAALLDALKGRWPSVRDLRPVGAEAPDEALRVPGDEVAAAVVAVAGPPR